eukprot:5298145-Lingulodinium_polyedra.AAC.1
MPRRGEPNRAVLIRAMLCHGGPCLGAPWCAVRCRSALWCAVVRRGVQWCAGVRRGLPRCAA